MKSALETFFWDNAEVIVFLHILSAIVWVGGMISMRFAAHNSFLNIENPAFRLERIAQALKRLFIIVAPFIVILIITAVIMAVGWGFRAAAVDANHNVIDETAMYIYNVVHIKEGIWMIMALNYGYMVYRLNRATKALVSNDVIEAKKYLEMIGKYLVPANITLGVVALYLGVVLRYSH